MNLSLKTEILKSGKKQYMIALEVGLSERRLSQIVTGRTPPTEEEIDRLEKILGKDRTDLGFEQPLVGT